jgi:hypothetical protein
MSRIRTTNETEFGWRNGIRGRNPKRVAEGAEARGEAVRGVVGREASVGAEEMRGAAAIPRVPPEIVQALRQDVESEEVNRVT